MMRRRRGRAAALHEPNAPAVARLASVAGQDMEFAEESDGTEWRWRIALCATGAPPPRAAGPQTEHCVLSAGRLVKSLFR